MAVEIFVATKEGTDLVYRVFTDKVNNGFIVRQEEPNVPAQDFPVQAVPERHETALGNLQKIYFLIQRKGFKWDKMFDEQIVSSMLQCVSAKIPAPKTKEEYIREYIKPVKQQRDAIKKMVVDSNKIFLAQLKTMRDVYFIDENGQFLNAYRTYIRKNIADIEGANTKGAMMLPEYSMQFILGVIRKTMSNISNVLTSAGVSTQQIAAEEKLAGVELPSKPPAKGKKKAQKAPAKPVKTAPIALSPELLKQRNNDLEILKKAEAAIKGKIEGIDKSDKFITEELSKLKTRTDIAPQSISIVVEIATVFYLIYYEPETFVKSGTYKAYASWFGKYIAPLTQARASEQGYIIP